MTITEPGYSLRLFDRCRILHRQIAGAKRANDRLAVEKLCDSLARAELLLTASERLTLWTEARRGVEPAAFPRSPIGKARKQEISPTTEEDA